MIKDATKKAKGAAGPSGMDANGWCRILISSNFGNVEGDLRKSIAEMTKRLCRERCANYLAAFLACRLIPLDKQPGVKPIGVGEVSGRVLGKLVITLCRKDILKVTGTLQFFAGQNAGSKAAIHAVYDMFNGDDNEAILMLDASNAFNSINR